MPAVFSPFGQLSGIQPAHERPGATNLHLLGGFELTLDGRPLQLAASAQRLISFLALHERPLMRPYVAGTLWLNSSEQHSGGCLRSALWRLGKPDYHFVEAIGAQLKLAEHITVDFRQLDTRARCLVARQGPLEPDDLHMMMTAGELLPDSYEDWVVIERERIRQLRMHALEAISRRLCSEGRYAEAVEAGLAAVDCEPLRESAHRAVVAAHIGEGNMVEALRQYQRYRRRLNDELGCEPSPSMNELVAQLRSMTIETTGRRESTTVPPTIDPKGSGTELPAAGVAP